MKRHALSIAIASALPVLAQAAEVSTCENWVSQARNIAEPWEDNTAVFANGAVRIAILDTVEPALAAFHLLVLSPPYDVLGERQCRVVSRAGGLGFTDLSLDGLSTAYNPATGLEIEIAVQFDTTGEPLFDLGALSVRINQATGDITAETFGG